MLPQQAPPLQQQQVDRDKIYHWIIELASPDTRENALLELRSVLTILVSNHGNILNQ